MRLLASRPVAIPARRLLLSSALVACAVVALLVLGGVRSADADLQSKINAKSSRAEALRAAVAAETSKIRASSRGLARAQRRLSKLRAQASAQEAELKAVEQALARARDRLTRLVNRQRNATDALRANLQTAYRNPQPDIVSVIVSAAGFTDLLERAEFYKRIARQNARIMDVARTTRAQVAEQTNRLAKIQVREQGIAARLDRQRGAAQAVQTALLREREKRLARSNFKRAELRDVQSQLARLRRRLERQARAGIRTNAGGLAQPPAGAPPQIGLVMAAGNAIAGLPYQYGGGHGSFKANAYDCSGSVSYALAAAGLVNSPMASGPFMSWGDPGPGKWITVYANAGHAFMVVAGWRFDTSALGGGTRWTRSMRGTGGFVARHPPGL
jgi:peptidoglycan hydrolase CwlO-like protein